MNRIVVTTMRYNGNFDENIEKIYDADDVGIERFGDQEVLVLRKNGRIACMHRNWNIVEVRDNIKGEQVA